MYFLNVLQVRDSSTECTFHCLQLSAPAAINYESVISSSAHSPLHQVNPWALGFLKNNLANAPR